MPSVEEKITRCIERLREFEDVEEVRYDPEFGVIGVGLATEKGGEIYVAIPVTVREENGEHVVDVGEGEVIADEEGFEYVDILLSLIESELVACLKSKQ